MAAPESTDEDGAAWVEKIFGNTIIFGAISKYLPFADLLDLRTSSSSLNKYVLDCQKFKRNAVFSVNEPRVKDGILNTLENLDAVDNICVLMETEAGVLDSPENLLRLWKLLTTKAKSIEFARSRGYGCIEKSKELLAEETNNQCFQNLGSLNLHKAFLNSVNLTRCSAIMDKLLTQPKELTLDGNCTGTMPNRMSKNLKFVNKRCVTLKKLRILSFFEDSGEPGRDKCMLDMFALISSNKNTLEELSVFDSSLWNASDPNILNEIKFSKLKECLIQGCETVDENKTLVNFLNNNPHIQNLGIHYHLACPAALLNAMISPTRKENLKKLDFSCGAFQVNRSNPRENPWQHLKEMESLKVLKLSQSWMSTSGPRLSTPSRDMGARALEHLWSCLPPNIEEVILERPRGCNLFNVRFEEWPKYTTKIDDIVSFNKLTKISLSWCVLTEGSVQLILAKMKHLINLQFIVCEGLTDYSLVGIKDLTNLKDLAISFCDGITNVVLAYIEHNSIITLDLGGNNSMNFTKDVLSSLIRRNPRVVSLELDRSDVDGYVDKAVSDDCNPYPHRATCWCCVCTLPKMRKYVSVTSKNRCSLSFFDEL